MGRSHRCSALQEAGCPRARPPAPAVRMGDLERFSSLPISTSLSEQRAAQMRGGPKGAPRGSAAAGQRDDGSVNLC